MSRAQIGAALRRARRHRVRSGPTDPGGVAVEQLVAPATTAAACGALVRSLGALIMALNIEIDTLAVEVERHFDRHPAAAIHRGQPGVAAILGSRLLAEFGDDPRRYVSEGPQELRGTSPITCQSGRKRTVQARYVHVTGQVACEA